MIGFGRLNHNSDFSFLHIKNPVGDFSPTGFVEQPKSIDYSSSFFFFANNPTPDNRAAIAGRIVPNVDVPVFGSSF